MRYLLQLDTDRLLSPYMREAGLPPKAESYTNWENTGLDGHIGGHYLSALSLMYASTGNEAIGERLEYMLAELKRVQQAHGNGYLGGIPNGKKMWTEIAAGNIVATKFRLNGEWVPLYNIHKMYAGLRDAWIHTGNEDAREMLIALTDWMEQTVSGLSDKQVQEMLESEHGSLNEVFADVAEITGEERYLTLASRFSHREILEPLLIPEDRLTGLHANTQIPKILGFKRVADLENNDEWYRAAQFFWETVTENRSVCFGGNSAHEHFHPVDDFFRVVSTEQGPETCNTYNMLRLTMMLNRDETHRRYTDYYEKALYNHILSSQHSTTGGLVYFTPIRPAHYRVYSQPETSMWCCVGSGIESHSRYGEMIYAHKGEDLYVNLFIPSRLDWQEKGTEIVQTNRFPFEPSTKIRVNPIEPLDFSIKFRWPSWSERVEVTVNGNEEVVVMGSDGFATLARKWKKGDEIKITFSMQLDLQTFADGSDFTAVTYGPVVLASRNETEAIAGVFADDSRGGHIAHGPKIPFAEIPTVEPEPEKLLASILPVAGSPLHFTLPTSGGEAKLEPFFQLHESRYTIYWPTHPIESPVDALNAATIDVVKCGQQQPESDHLIHESSSVIGYAANRHWRKADEWFSYEMKNPDKSARYLLVYFLDGESGASAVFVNGEQVKTVSSKNGKDEEAYVLISLTDNAARENLTIKITAMNDRPTPRYTELRLLSRSVAFE